MPMDEYDLSHTSYDKVINVYYNDNIDDVISQFFLQNNELNNENEIIISHMKYNQKEENEMLSKRIKDCITKLKNGLSILDYRTITNIGGRVAYTIVPKNYNVLTRFVLIQVWRR
jgi:hypothetical protein